MQPNRARQAPFTQLQVDTSSGPGALEVTRPVPVESAKVVAKVGTEVILAADVLPHVENELKTLAPRCPPEQLDELRRMLMAKHVKMTVETKLIVQEMKKGVPDDKWPDMEKQIMQHFEQYALPEMKKKAKVTTDQELEAKMKEQGTSLKQSRRSFLEMMLVNEWMRKNAKCDEHVTHEQMLAYYHQHHAEYEFPAKARFEEIRVNYGKRRGRQDAWNLVCRLGNQAYSGSSMAELAKKHSESPHADQGGLHDWTRKGSLKCQALDDVLFSLPIGALSNPVDDGRGFIIVRVVERTEAGATSFKKAQSGIRETIKAERAMEARNKAITEFQEKSKSRVWTLYDDLLNPPRAQTVKKKTPNNFLR